MFALGRHGMHQCIGTGFTFGRKTTRNKHTRKREKKANNSGKANERTEWSLARSPKTTCRINSVNVRDRHYLTSALLTRGCAIFLWTCEASALFWHDTFFLNFITPVCSLELPFRELNKMQCIKNCWSCATAAVCSNAHSAQYSVVHQHDLSK